MFGIAEDPEQRVELLESVWASAEFTSLSQTEQDALRARYGTGTVVEAPAPVVEIRTEAAPATAAKVEAPPAAAWPERREHGKKPPLKRVFKQYRIAHDGINDKLIIVEDVDVYDDAKGAYEPKLGIPTKIGIPQVRLPDGKTLEERILAKSEVGSAVVEAATEVRTKLDENGLKLFLDEARWDIPKEQAQSERSAVVNKDGSVKRLYLKWKYKIDEKQQAKDFLDLSEVPDGILKLLKEDKDYWKRPEWKKWFGVQMQKKREEIISQEILNAIGEGIGEAEGPEMDVQTSAEIAETDDEVEVAKPAAAEPTVAPAPTPAPASKVDTAPTSAPAAAGPWWTEPVRATAAAAGTPRVDAAPAAPAPTPDVAKAEPPKEVTAEQLQKDVANEVRKSIAAYRRAYRDDVTGLANRVISSAFVLLSEKYALAHAPIDVEHLFSAIKDAAAAELGLMTPENEPAMLLEALRGYVQQALKDVEHKPGEADYMATSIRDVLLQGKKIAHVDHVPGKSFAVKDVPAFLERIRTLHRGLREQSE